jgi:hypothetical protein
MFTGSKFKVMKHSRRNIPDPVSPQNPVNKTDITPDRIQDHLEDKTSVEDIFRDENELTRHQADEIRIKSQRQAEDLSPEDEAGL